MCFIIWLMLMSLMYMKIVIFLLSLSNWVFCVIYCSTFYSKIDQWKVLLILFFWLYSTFYRVNSHQWRQCIKKNDDKENLIRSIAWLQNVFGMVKRSVLYYRFNTEKIVRYVIIVWLLIYIILALLLRFAVSCLFTVTV